jgi:hypothetical protein
LRVSPESLCLGKASCFDNRKKWKRRFHAHLRAHVVARKHTVAHLRHLSALLRADIIVLQALTAAARVEDLVVAAEDVNAGLWRAGAVVVRQLVTLLPPLQLLLCFGTKTKTKRNETKRHVSFVESSSRLSRAWLGTPSIFTRSQETAKTKTNETKAFSHLEVVHLLHLVLIAQLCRLPQAAGTVAWHTRSHAVSRLVAHGLEEQHLRKPRSLSEFSLCLSRACLGKMTAFV